jgi:hypothetical protein
MGARPLPEIYCFIYLTSGFAGLVFVEAEKFKMGVYGEKRKTFIGKQ